MGVCSLVGAADDGDVGRFEQLILANRAQLKRFLTMVYRSRGRHFIECVECGTESRAWEKFSYYDPERGSFISWLICLARHVAGEETRLGRFNTEQSMEALAESGRVPAVDGPANRHEAAELKRALWQAVRCLPKKIRFPFILCDVDGYSRAEAARRLKAGEEAVRYRLNQARRMMRRLLSMTWISHGSGTDWVKNREEQGMEEAEGG